MKKKIFILCIFAFTAAILCAVYSVYASIQLWTYPGPDVVFKINPGEPFSKINYRLAQKGILSSPKVFFRYAKINNLLTSFKSGNYLIKHNSNMLDVIETLINGVAITVKVTLPEGKNLFEIGKILEKNGICSYDQFVKLAKNPDFTKQMGINADRVEGYLYPDTYNFSPNSAPDIVIKTMLKEFVHKTEHVNFKLSTMSKQQVITLASIVEKETGAAHERPVIAGVFLNRLEKRMRLQTDPTIIYGIFEHFDGNIQIKHKLEVTPYNTYKIDGLPRGPICNPGIDAIMAVLNPVRHDFLYFVSKNDGTHLFSATYKDHIEGVNKFQKDRRNRIGKSWRDLKQDSSN